MAELPKIWTVKSPFKWARSPEWMSFHYLSEAERCPRAISLRNSTYEGVWLGKGYPDRPNLFALIGRIVHLAIQKIICELAERECDSLHRPEAIQILKEMGGYSAIITAITDEVLTSQQVNPRFARQREHISSTLRSRMPQIREQVQVFLSRLKWATGLRFQRQHRQDFGARTPIARAELREGTHAEVKLLDRRLKWKGIADLVEIHGGMCSIVDFKTGEPSEAHRLQLMIYALLWRSDTDLNPKSLPPGRLVVSYTERDEIQPLPSSEQLDRLAEQLQTRTHIVRKQVDTELPIANVSAQNCSFCQVRSMCQDYWDPTKRLGLPIMKGGEDDLQVVLGERRGQNTWEAECQVSGVIPPQTKILLRGSGLDVLASDHFRPGISIRLTEAYIVVRDSGELPLVRFTSSTEFLFL